MPRSKSIKTIFFEFVMYIGMFAVVGHISENLFQRLIIQNELVTLKSDLNSLQLYINSLEMAYDTLCDEFQVPNLPTKKANKPLRRQLPSEIMYKTSKDSKILGLYNQLVDVKTSFFQTTNGYMQNLKKSVEDFTQECKIPAKDSSSIERHIKCILDDSIIDGDVKDCKCVIKCPHLSDLKVKPENMKNDAIMLAVKPDQHEPTANVTD